MSAKIKKGDEVQVLSGRSKDVKGEVLSVYPVKDLAIVRGVNIVTRHQKPSQTQQGGLVKKESPIHISNLALLDPQDGKPTRVGFKFNDAGKKLRYSKRSGEFIADKGVTDTKAKAKVEKAAEKQAEVKDKDEAKVKVKAKAKAKVKAKAKAKG